uniref:Cell cycle protein n=1 Tax=Siphoviridae sp. ct16M3 TaxID=2825305 RepID=A0A8S5PRF0_9CAUD|nr:MAG TPA: Cell cycle protein [Siphoviridae sp. ct16M3]
MEEEILNHKKYIDTAKEIWGIVDEQFRVTQNVEEKLSSKADEFNKRFLKEHPEVSKEDVEYFRQAVAGEVNKGKQAVLENSEILKKLQEENQELKSKNIDLESKLAAISNYVPVENK